MLKQTKTIKQANREVFERPGYDYEKKRRVRFDRKTAQNLLSRYEQAMGAKFGSHERFLDFGCGSGYIGLNLCSLGLFRQCFGADISYQMLDKCRKHSHDLGLPMLLVQSDAEMLAFGNNSFDCIVGHAILHHLFRLDSTFKEVYRILKPGGMCIFSEPNRIGSRIIALLQWSVWLVPMAIRQCTKTEAERKAEHDTFSPEKLEALARAAGFNKVFTRPFAGFLSRIFYWLFDPLSQRLSNKYYHRCLEALTEVLYIVDRRFFSRFVPKSWFDEICIVMYK